ncbi:MAG: VOC family protein [Spirochaetaceae bacterium]
MELTEELLGLQHIGIPVTALDESISFYKSIGFKVDKKYSIVVDNDPIEVAFIKLHDLNIELYQKHGLTTVKTNGAIDHLALNCKDIDKMFEFCKKGNYRFEEDKISELPFFKNGVKYFIILGPDNEKVEFNQYL